MYSFLISIYSRGKTAYLTLRSQFYIYLIPELSGTLETLFPFFLYLGRNRKEILIGLFSVSGLKDNCWSKWWLNVSTHGLELLGLFLNFLSLYQRFSKCLFTLPLLEYRVGKFHWYSWVEEYPQFYEKVIKNNLPLSN